METPNDNPHPQSAGREAERCTHGVWLADHCYKCAEMAKEIESAPQSAGSLRIEGGPEPVAERTPKPTSAFSPDSVRVEDIAALCKLWLRSKTKHDMDAIVARIVFGGTTNETGKEPIQPDAACPPNETLYRRLPIGSDVERGDLVYQTIHSRPQKRQPDDAPRAGESEAILKAIDDEPELPGTPPDEIYREYERVGLAEVLRANVRATKKSIRARVLSALPTNAEAQADLVGPEITDERASRPTSALHADLMRRFPMHVAADDLINPKARVYLKSHIDGWVDDLYAKLRPAATSQAQQPKSAGAEAQAPVSAEAMEWLHRLSDDPQYHCKQEAREILRTLGATPAQP